MAISMSSDRTQYHLTPTHFCISFAAVPHIRLLDLHPDRLRGFLADAASVGKLFIMTFQERQAIGAFFLHISALPTLAGNMSFRMK